MARPQAKSAPITRLHDAFVTFQPIRGGAAILGRPARACDDAAACILLLERITFSLLRPRAQRPTCGQTPYSISRSGSDSAAGRAAGGGVSSWLRSPAARGREGFPGRCHILLRPLEPTE